MVSECLGGISVVQMQASISQKTLNVNDNMFQNSKWFSQKEQCTYIIVHNAIIMNTRRYHKKQHVSRVTRIRVIRGSCFQPLKLRYVPVKI